MIKNNKGFTLVELLAAIAVFSILIVLTLPQITNMIAKNRDLIYVNDALKMISQAEYKMRANSTVIEKPDEGECIVFSLNYLDNNSFDNPPNKGEYLRYASFVVVKNDDGNLEYSALLVEAYDENSYKGVKLTREEDLNKSNAVKNVVSFDKDTIVYINDDISSKYAGDGGTNRTIDVEYINRYLGEDYVSIIDDRLVDDVVDHEGTVENLGVPRINSFVVVSASSKDFNTLDMKILVDANDSDTPAEGLKVYYNICTKKLKDSGSVLCDYPDTSNPSTSSYPYSTGGSTSFSSPVINLSQAEYGANYGEDVVIYLVVSDNDGNFVRKQKTYTIHTNEKPTINTFEITKRDGDPSNLLKAKAVIDVNDDIDEYGSLKYCISNNENATIGDCTDFQPLNESSFNYDFCDGDVYSAACLPDGSIRTGKIFVMDSQGEWDSKEFRYEVYNLDVASLTPTVTITSNGTDVPKGKKSLKVKYKVTINFDPASGIQESDITYVLGLCESSSKCNSPILETSPISYSRKKTGTYEMYSDNFPIYDGKQRRLSVRVYINKYGLSSTKIQKITKYTPYLNTPPGSTGEFSRTFISQEDNFVGHASPESGTYNTIYKLIANDDLDGNNFWTCISESSDGCDYNTTAEFESKFSKYSENNEYTFTPENIDSPYDGSTKTLYVKMCDRYYLTSGMNTCNSLTETYNIYENQGPTATYPPVVEPDYSDISSEDIINDSVHINKISVKSNFIDDLDDQSKLTVRVGYKKSGESTYSYTNEQQFAENLSFIIGGDNFTYDGSTYDLIIQAKDSFGKYTDSPAVISYSVYKNDSPEIKSVEFKNKCKEVVENGTTTCVENTDINESSFYVVAYVKDYFDTYNICVSENRKASSCTNYTNSNFSGDTPSIGNKSNLYTLINSDYTADSPATIYLHIKDSGGNITTKKLNYNVYKSCQNQDEMIETNISHLPIDDNHKVTPKACSGECYKKSDDDNTSSRVFQYNRHFDLMDPFITGRLCQTNQSSLETLYCSFETCFYNNDGNPTYWLIGNRVNYDTNSSGAKIVYTYSGDVPALSNKTFTDYHKVYKLVSTNIDGHMEYALVLYDDIRVPDKINGMSNYNFRDYFKFNSNDDTSYLVFGD